jgi:hypothetical protein
MLVDGHFSPPSSSSKRSFFGAATRRLEPPRSDVTSVAAQPLNRTVTPADMCRVSSPNVVPMVAPGWYHDPLQPAAIRYFDGFRWTEHVAPAPPTGPPGYGWATGSTDAVVPGGTGTGSSPQDPMHWIIPVGRTWQSIAAGYVALFAIVFWFLGPIALWLGIAGLRAASSRGGHGRGRAVFAIAVGAPTTLLTALMIVGIVWG